MKNNSHLLSELNPLAEFCVFSRAPLFLKEIMVRAVKISRRERMSTGLGKKERKKF